MKWGTRAYSMQFHVEIEGDTVGNWAQIPAYADALTAALGPNGVSRMTQDCDEEMRNFNTIAERIYINWLQATART